MGFTWVFVLQQAAWLKTIQQCRWSPRVHEPTLAKVDSSWGRKPEKFNGAVHNEGQDSTLYFVKQRVHRFQGCMDLVANREDAFLWLKSGNAIMHREICRQRKRNRMSRGELHSQGHRRHQYKPSAQDQSLTQKIKVIWIQGR